MSKHILVVEDEEILRFTFTEFLSSDGYKVTGAKDYDEALHSINLAIRLDPAASSLHASKGYILSCRGEHDEAVASYSEAIQSNATDAMLRHAHLERAASYRHLGLEAKAEEDERAAAELWRRLTVE